MFTLPIIRPILLHAVLTMALIAAHPACAEEKSDTLKKIVDSGTITLGFHETTIPFSYTVGDGVVTGYSYEFALKIADALKRELKLPTLRIKPAPVTTQNRFPMVQNGAVDIHCGATTHTSERQKIVAFSNTIFIAGSRLMTRKDSGIKDFDDLNGKNVATFARSTSEKMLRKMVDERNFRINIMTSYDRGDSPLSMLQAGQADAYMMDDVLLYAAVRETWRPDEWIVTGKPQSYEAYACILRKDDPAFKKLVDKEIARIMKSGEAEALYKKWLMSPIPPKGVNLGFAMSEAVSDLFKNPNDKPFD